MKSTPAQSNRPATGIGVRVVVMPCLTLYAAQVLHSQHKVLATSKICSTVHVSLLHIGGNPESHYELHHIPLFSQLQVVQSEESCKV